MSSVEEALQSAAVSISLIVCTTARTDRLNELLPRLRNVARSDDLETEVLIVDNSMNGRLVGLNEPGIRVVRSALPGLSRARTVGCIQAHGDVLVFTDDDVEFAADWPSRMAKPIIDGKFDATAAPIALGSELDVITSPLMRGWLAEANISGGQPVLVGAGMAIHRNLLNLGLWDQRLGAGVVGSAFGEESLFELMILAKGARIGVVIDAGVVHHPDISRLDPLRWRRTAEEKGLSEAYIAYHWVGDRLPLPFLRVLRRKLRLGLHRRLWVNDASRFERELILTYSLALAVGFSRESKFPRAYGMRESNEVYSSPTVVLPE